MNKEIGIVEFSTDKNKYIFDAVSGEIIPAGRWGSYIIKNYISMTEGQMIEDCMISDVSKEDFKNEYYYIKTLIEENMFFNSNPIEEKININKYVNNANTSQLLLVLTGKCNMRCEYCVYCEKYPKEIGYFEEDMDFATAKKSVDIYFELHRKKVAHGYRKPPMINFYGGEPLLQFELIKNIVNYVEGYNLSTKFYITTNGLLINEEVADFISNHNFSVTFSLDGFKENHDRNRVTAGGKPTFEILLKNIKNLQQIKRKKNALQTISFNCCYDNYTDLEKCIVFFEENYNEFFPFFIMYSQINPYDTSYYQWTKDRVEKGEIKLEKDTFNKSYELIKKRVLTDNQKLYKTEITMNLFTSTLMLYLRSRWSNTCFNNSCIPLSKLAVYPSGEICLCEKMNKKLVIGDITSGINYEKLENYTKLLTDNFTKGKCVQCEAKRICSACFVHMDENGEMKQEFCETQRQTLRGRLEELYQILEDNQGFMEMMHISNEFSEFLEINN